MTKVTHSTNAFAGNRKIGDANTYIQIDTVNKKIQVFVDNTQVIEWS